MYIIVMLEEWRLRAVYIVNNTGVNIWAFIASQLTCCVENIM